MYAVEMKNILKQYPLVRAVDHVDFRVEKAEVHCLLGENGAGKTTLMKVLYGMTKPDAGTLHINGAELRFKRPNDAIAQGIAMVHQHFQLAPVFTVAENIVVGDERQNPVAFNLKKAIAEVNQIIQDYGFQIDASQKVESLSVGEQQRVEIIKALYRKAKILILDEPTAVLTPQEVDELFRIIKQMRSDGLTVIIITHKLKEAIQISDHVSVMRDGKMVNMAVPTRECTVDILAKMMVGRDVSMSSTRRAVRFGDLRFTAKQLTVVESGKKVLDQIHLEIRSGEILGIAGVEGNGQTELIEALTGLRHPDTMELILEGQRLSGDGGDFIAAGVGHIPENRLSRGLVSSMTIQDNLILGYHRKKEFCGRQILHLKNIKAYARKLIGDYSIKTPGEKELVSSLSGGNQQKIVIGRVFSQNPRLIIVAQPTRGVDVGAMEYIHKVLLDLRDAGAAILLISADLDEVRRLSDRLAIIYEGRLVHCAPTDELNELEIGQLMLSGTLDKAKEAG